jgi:hypothetical protein
MTFDTDGGTLVICQVLSVSLKSFVRVSADGRLVKVKIHNALAQQVAGFATSAYRFGSSGASTSRCTGVFGSFFSAGAASDRNGSDQTKQVTTVKNGHRKLLKVEHHAS